jgi:hypothetical protein
MNVCGHPYSLQIGSQVSDLSERSPADTWTMEFDYFAPAAEAVIRRSQKAGVQMDFALLRHEVGPSEDDLHREALIRAVRRFGKSEEVAVSPQAVPMETISIERFYGSTFDRDSRRVLLGDLWGLGGGGRWTPQASIPPEERTTPEDSWGPFRWADEEDSSQVVYIKKALWQPGFAYSFLHPPPWHQIQMEPADAQALFLSFDDLVLGRPLVGAPISYSEADPVQAWAPYFEDKWAFHWGVGPSRR